jgi:hypothetical protein
VEDDDDYLKRPSHTIANVSSFLGDKIAGMTRLVRDVVVKLPPKPLRVFETHACCTNTKRERVILLEVSIITV